MVQEYRRGRLTSLNTFKISKKMENKNFPKGNVGKVLPKNKTMTSREVAEIAGKQHKHLLESIRNMESAWEKTTGSRSRLSEFKDSTPLTFLHPEIGRQSLTRKCLKSNAIFSEPENQDFTSFHKIVEREKGGVCYE
jgi:hypothetical protein